MKKTKKTITRYPSTLAKEELCAGVISRAIGEIPSIHGWWYRIPGFDYEPQLKDNIELMPSMGSLFGVIDSSLIFMPLKIGCVQVRGIKTPSLQHKKEDWTLLKNSFRLRNISIEIVTVCLNEKEKKHVKIGKCDYSVKDICRLKLKPPSLNHKTQHNDVAQLTCTDAKEAVDFLNRQSNLKLKKPIVSMPKIM